MAIAKTTRVITMIPLKPMHWMGSGSWPTAHNLSSPLHGGLCCQMMSACI